MMRRGPEYWAGRWAEEFSRQHVGQHRAPERCTDPASHERLERGAAQEHRPRAQVLAGHCEWCGGRR